MNRKVCSGSADFHINYTMRTLRIPLYVHRTHVSHKQTFYGENGQRLFAASVSRISPLAIKVGSHLTTRHRYNQTTTRQRNCVTVKLDGSVYIQRQTGQRHAVNRPI